MRAPNRGTSFVEILVATGLMVAVLLPILYLFTQSMRTSEVSLDELTATNLASEIIEQMKIMPSALGFRQMVATPIPNPPPAFPEWQQLPAAGAGFGEADPNAQPHPPPIETKGWTLLGTSYWLDPAIDSAVVARSRLYLSALPAGHSRFLKIHHPVADPTGAIDPNLWQVMVRLDWSRTFLGAPTQKRSTTMGTLLAFPAFNP